MCDCVSAGSCASAVILIHVTTLVHSIANCCHLPHSRRCRFFLGVSMATTNELQILTTASPFDTYRVSTLAMCFANIESRMLCSGTVCYMLGMRHSLIFKRRFSPCNTKLQNAGNLQYAFLPAFHHQQIANSYVLLSDIKWYVCPANILMGLEFFHDFIPFSSFSSLSSTQKRT